MRRSPRPADRSSTATITQSIGALWAAWRWGACPPPPLTVLLLYFLKVDSATAKSLITKVLGLAILFTAASLLFRKQLMRWYDHRIGELPAPLVFKLTVLTGAVLGVLVTLSSVGAGAIGVVALVMLYPKMPARQIVGSDIAHAVPLNSCGRNSAILFLGSIDFHILTSLLAGSIPAIVVMSMVSARASDTAVRVALAVVLLAVCLRFWFF